MRVPRNLPCCVLVFFVLAALCASAAGLSVFSGVVRDGSGKPIAGVSVTLSSQTNPPSSYRATSSPTGEYRFESLPAGEYELTAELSGYTPPQPSLVRIQSASAPATADLTLIRASTAPDAIAIGPDAFTPSHPKLEFQSAGIRGLIDPGGYSASTSGAASGLLRGIADVKRTGKSSGALAAKDWPCGLEPQLRKAATEHPEQAEANRRLGQFYVAHEQPGKAIPLLQRALEIDAGDDAASRELALAWLESGEFEKARKLLTPLAERRAEPELHQLLARADEGSGQFQQAAEEYRIADSKQPSEESIFGAGYEWMLAGSVADGAVAFQAGVVRYPHSIPMRAGLGTAEFYLGRTAEAVRAFLDAADIDPSDPRPYAFLSSLAGVFGDENARARLSFKRYYERNPDSAVANYFYALVLSRDSAAADASLIEALLKRAIQLDPNLAKAHLQLAGIYAQRNDDEDAVPEYEAAVRLAQDLPEAHYRLALAYKRAGKADLSAREMQIFRMAKQPKAAGGEGIGLAQFISVMDAPDGQAGQEVQCPASPR